MQKKAARKLQRRRKIACQKGKASNKAFRARQLSKPLYHAAKMEPELASQQEPLRKLTSLLSFRPVGG